MSIRTRKFDGKTFYSLVVRKGKEYARHQAASLRASKDMKVRVTPSTPRGYYEIWTEHKMVMFG